MMIVKKEIYTLQYEIMQLGLQFAESAKDSLGVENHKNIRAYFEANEYGEALNLIIWLRESNEAVWNAGSAAIIDQIQNLQEKVKCLYSKSQE